MSCDATSNLFGWYRDLEGGLWLEENQGKHPWVVYDSDEDEYSGDEDDTPGDEESNPPSDDSRIRSWQESISSNIALAPSVDDMSSSHTMPELDLTVTHSI